MSAPAVSVVIPVGSVDDDLAVQLRAVLAQVDAPEFEVVLAANTSEPNQVVRLSRLAETVGDPRVRIVDASARRGASFARNTGAAAARGSILAFCDGDDIVHADWLKQLILTLDDADVVGGRLIIFADSGELPKWRPPATPDALPLFLGVPYLLSGNMAIERSLFTEIGGFDESLTRCEDIAISWRLLNEGKTLAFASDAIVDYRVRGSVKKMLNQHYLYGIGMSEVLARIKRPGAVDGTNGEAGPPGRMRKAVDIARMLKPNNQSGGLRSPIGVLRKLAIGVGRVVGLARESRRKR